MSDQGVSVLAYFLGGAVGALMSLFITLLYDKQIAILENDLIPRRGLMAILYVVSGGLLAVVLNVTIDSSLDPGKVRLAFATGLGWPAIALGIIAGKQIAEVNRSKDQIRATLEATAERQQRVASDYIESRLTQAIETAQLVQERAEKEKEEMRQFFEKRLSDIGGQP